MKDLNLSRLVLAIHVVLRGLYVIAILLLLLPVLLLLLQETLPDHFFYLLFLLHPFFSLAQRGVDYAHDISHHFQGFFGENEYFPIRSYRGGRRG